MTLPNLPILPKHVNIVEVGPRDGLQNEQQLLPVETKVELIERLTEAGLRRIEVASFVSPRWVPQMADSAEVLRTLRRTIGQTIGHTIGRTRGRRNGVRYAALIPNMQGFDGAVDAAADEVAIFASASESFSKKNINCTIAESLARFEPVLAAAGERQLPVRGYVSCIIACPYEGPIAAQQVARVAKELIDMGCYEVSLGDTIGVGTPEAIKRLIDTCAQVIPLEQLAGHYHDTYGMAIANIYASLQQGVTTFDTSVAGLGGCPYAGHGRGASGNVATEDLVFMLDGLGIGSGVDLPRLAETGGWISHQLGRANGSKAGLALDDISR